MFYPAAQNLPFLQMTTQPLRKALLIHFAGSHGQHSQRCFGLTGR